jgi:hypothetical protein
MKHTMRFLAALAMLFTFAACDPTEDTPTPDNQDDPTITQTDVQFTIDTTEWSIEDNFLYATVTWRAKIVTEGLTLSEFFDEDMQKSYSYGIGYFPVGAENNLPRYFNGSNDQSGCYHRIISVNNDSTEFTIVSHIKADNRKEARAYLYLVEASGVGEFYYSQRFYLDPADAPGHGGEAFVRIDDTDYDYSEEVLTVYATANFGGDGVPYAVGLCYKFADAEDMEPPTIDDYVFNVMDHVTGPNQFDDSVNSMELNSDGSYSISFSLPMYEGPIYILRGFLQMEHGGEVIYSEPETFMPSAK